MGSGSLKTFFEKIAKLKDDVQLFSHQQQAVDKLVSNKGVGLVAHHMGLGKTLTSIAAFEKTKGPGDKALVVLPAGLKQNFVDNIEQFTDSSHYVISKADAQYPNVDYYIISYNLLLRHYEKVVDKVGPKTIIADEIHNARNEDTKTYKTLMDIRPKVDSFIGLTGSIINNDPSDIVPQLNIVSNKGHELGSSEMFNNKFLRKVEKRKYIPILSSFGIKGGVEDIGYELKNAPRLKKELGKYVHYMGMDSVDNLPDKILERKEVEMSPEQKRLYDFVFRNLPRASMNKIKKGLPIDEKELFHILPMLQKARELSSGTHVLKDMPIEEAAARTPKLSQALTDIKDHLSDNPNGKIVVYSNFVAGLEALSASLDAEGVSHGVFIGAGSIFGDSRVSNASRQEAVDNFKKGETQVILISSAGKLGLSFPNATMHITLDGHWNPEIISQSEARSIRQDSEADKIQVRQYVSVPPRKLLGLMGRDSSIDEMVWDVSGRKAKKNDLIYNLLRDKSLSKTAGGNKMYKEALQEFEMLSKIYDKDKLEKIAEEVLDRDEKEFRSNHLVGALGAIPGAVLGTALWPLAAMYSGAQLGGQAGSLAATSAHKGIHNLFNRKKKKDRSSIDEEVAQFSAREPVNFEKIVDNIDDFEVAATSDNDLSVILRNKHTGELFKVQNYGEEIGVAPFL